MNNTNKIPLEECQYCIVIDKDSDYYKQVVFTHCKEGNYWVCDNNTSYLEKDLLPIIGNEFSFYENDDEDKIITVEAYAFHPNSNEIEFEAYAFHPNSNEIEFDEYEVHITDIILDNIASKSKLTNFNFY